MGLINSKLTSSIRISVTRFALQNSLPFKIRIELLTDADITDFIVLPSKDMHFKIDGTIQISLVYAKKLEPWFN
jgi:hypothetical protein